jgi:peptidyl-prolyl cis-trans isomerase C
MIDFERWCLGVVLDGRVHLADMLCFPLQLAKSGAGRPASPTRQTLQEAFMAKATARHILVDGKEHCEALKAEIDAGRDFAEVAREHSRCPSGRKGGDLGSFGPGQMVREFDEVVFAGELNTVHGPVKTQFGYHLLEITSRS